MDKIEKFGLVRTWSESSGNGWKASRPIKEGEILMHELPLSFGIYSDRALEFCGICLKNISNSATKNCCNSCTSFYFCNLCHEKHTAITEHIKICEIINETGRYKKNSETVFARFFLKLFRDPEIEEIGENKIVGNLNIIFELMQNEEGIEPLAMQEANFWSSKITKLSDNEEFQNNFSGIDKIKKLCEKQGRSEEEKQKILTQKIKEIFLKSMYNWHAIPDDSIDNDDIGYAIYPNTCFFNHSCSPNSAWLINRNQSAIFCATAIKDIREGQEIFISYFGHDQNVPTSKRRDYLLEYYQFTCNCDRCTQVKDCYMCEGESKYFCSRCKKVKYCSAECQKKHWTTHKTECVPIKK